VLTLLGCAAGARLPALAPAAAVPAVLLLLLLLLLVMPSAAALPAQALRGLHHR